jgi:hypothetical protein
MSNLITGDFPVSTYRNLNMSTTGAVVKAAKAQIFSISVYNNATAVRFLKLYDKATAATASDTPIMTIGLTQSALNNISVGQGIEFLNGISVRATTLVADNDATAPATNDVVLNIGYL